ncbi:MAG: BON domain-containing protein [Rhodospirillales bacterium]|nr:BON domain-containing protein [Rhodospirillales bacterium]
MSEAPHDDAWMARAVAEELEWAPHVDAAHIHVSVQDGIVHLTGHVRTLVEKKAAERTVWHVAGVRGIAADLEIRRPAAHLHSDDEIARRAADVLDWDAQIPNTEIKVQVEGGVVTLLGAVDWQYQRAQAEARVQQLAGVVAVDNRIVVRAVPTAADEVHEQVLRALRRHAEIDASGIAVEVQGGCVTLTGHVPSFAQRRIAETAAWSARGVTDVIDHVRVESARTSAAV